MVILLLALLVLGPDKLPEYTRKAGRYVNEFRRMTSGFQEEFRQAMDLSDLTSPPTAESMPASGADALDRSTDGPRLVPQAETISPPPPPPAAAPAPVAEAAPMPTAAPSPSPAPAPAAFAAEVTPAPGTGPELITPTRPRAGHEDDTGSSSAA